jgi:hypothetical protein
MYNLAVMIRNKCKKKRLTSVFFLPQLQVYNPHERQTSEIRLPVAFSTFSGAEVDLT